ncbi:MAG: sugar ABC transporter permease [Ancalomicrobiaceae bacterium]|nr:sugar ABC transporter permease [Ancalomicrobiaceae bacterium]
MSTEAVSGADHQERASFGSYLKNNIREYGMLISLIAIMLYFQYSTDGKLFNPDNLTSIIQQRGYIVVMALGMLLIIVAGHIDLSVGWLSGFLGAVSAIAMVDYGMPWYLGVAITVVVGVVVGCVQGYSVAYLKMPSFIVTLAGMLVFRGLTLNTLGGRNVGPFPDEISTLLTGFFPEFVGKAPDPFVAGGTVHVASLAISVVVVVAMLLGAFMSRAKQVARGMNDEPFVIFVIKNFAIAGMLLYLCYLFATYKGLPNVFVIIGVLIAFYSFIATRTVIGRRVFALGGNEKAAKLSGINTERLVFYAFINMGVLTALAGMMFATRLGWATPKAGEGFELDVIAACFIGGASAYGGVGTVMGAVIGAFIMGVLNNGMTMEGIGIDWQFMIKGAVLFFAVLIDVYNKTKS